jgi:benzoate/toluate 1,2-dioxygenase reductase subunit
VNSNDDLVEIETLKALQATLPDFDFYTCVVDRHSGHPKLGYVTDHLTAGHLHDGNVDVYVCGPPPMVEGVRKWLAGCGVTPKSFHFEKFSSASATVGETAVVS